MHDVSCTASVIISMFYFNLKDMQRAKEVKGDKCVEVQQDINVTLQSVKVLQAETNSIDNEVL